MARARTPPQRSQRKQYIRTFIPPDRYNFNFKVVVTDSDGTETVLSSYNGTNHVTMIKIKGRSLMRGFKTADVTILNPMGLFNTLISRGDTIDIYAEYTKSTSITPTRKQFKGKIMVRPRSLGEGDGFTMKLICWQLPELRQKRISISQDDSPGYFYITELVDNWFEDVITYNNLDSGMDTHLTRQYVMKYGGGVFNEIFDKCGFTGYIDNDNDIHSWSLEEPEENLNEFLAFGINCKTVDGFDEVDLRKIPNNVIVTGDRVEGEGELFYVWSKKDAADIALTWQRDDLLADNTIRSQDEIESEANLFFETKTRTDTNGRLSSDTYGLESIEPGQSIPCYVPHCGVDGKYIVHEYEHIISPTTGSWTTTVQLEKFKINIIDQMKVRDDKNKGNALASFNPNGMIGAHVITFGEDTPQVEHTSTKILNSTLMLDGAAGSGTARSIIKTVDANIIAVEVRLRGEDLGASSVDVSVDGGEFWDEDTKFNTGGETISQSTSQNKKNLLFDINLLADSDNVTPKVWSAVCLFRYAR